MARRARSGDPLVVVAYIRTSTGKQEISPEAQLASIERWCHARSARLAAVCKDVISGSTSLPSRPGFSAAVEALIEHKAGVFLVAKLDRVARDLFFSLTAEQVVKDRGAKLISAAGEGSEDEDPTQRQIHGVFSERERRIIRERTKAALAVKKAKGFRIGTVPFGFTADENGKLISYAKEQQIKTLIKQLRTEGFSIRSIAAELERRGMRGRGAGPIAPTSVVNLLKTDKVA